MTMKTIDFHNHYYPPVYLDAIRKGPSNYRVTMDDAGNPVLHSPGDYNVVVPGHRDIDYRQTVLDHAGIDMQVLTFTAPGTNLETPERAVPLCRLVNDAFATIVRERSDRFTALATLPLNDPAASVVPSVTSISSPPCESMIMLVVPDPRNVQVKSPRLLSRTLWLLYPLSVT